jgi:hypothetical protein
VESIPGHDREREKERMRGQRESVRDNVWLRKGFGISQKIDIKNINSYLETSGGQSSNLYLNVVQFCSFSIPLLIRHLWQIKTVISLHWCLIHASLLQSCRCHLTIYFCAIGFSLDGVVPDKKSG